MINAKPHHVGCAVLDLDGSCATYAGALGLQRRTRPLDIASQHIRVSFVELQPGFYLELISPLDEQAKLTAFLKLGFYHLCFLVDDLHVAGDELREQGFFPLPAFESEAFPGGACQFFLSPQRVYIELAQMTPSGFDAFFEANLMVDC